MQEQNEKFNKKIETIQKKKPKEMLELKNTMIELKNSIESFKRRLSHAEEKISMT